MSETAERLFNALSTAKGAAHTIAPGLKNIGADTKAEMSRLGSHGATEAAAALFQGSAFVLYGPGADRNKWGAGQTREQNEPAKEPQSGQDVHGNESSRDQGRGR